MKLERRWIKSTITATADAGVVMPWARGNRRKPEALKPAPAPVKARGIAAR